MGHEAGTAILPLYLALIGAPPFALGAIEAVSDGLSSAAKLAGGWLSDRVAYRRPWAALGYVATGITTGFYALATTWPGVLVARAIGWAGRGIRSPLHDSLLTETVPPEARGRAFGFDETADTLGAIAGPLLALALVALFSKTLTTIESYRWVFWIAAIPGLLAAVSLILVREQKNVRQRTPTFRGSLKALPSSFRFYLMGIFIFGIGDYANIMLILRSVQVLSPVLGSEGAGSIALLLYSVHNVFYAAGSLPVGMLADRLGKRWFLVGAYLLAAIYNILLITVTPSVALFALIFAMAGTVYSAQQSLERAIAADLAPEEVRGIGFGILATVNGIGDFVSSLTVGLLWSIVSPTAGFSYSFVLSVVGAVVMVIVLHPSRTMHF